MAFHLFFRGHAYKFIWSSGVTFHALFAMLMITASVLRFLNQGSGGITNFEDWMPCELTQQERVSPGSLGAVSERRHSRKPQDHSGKPR
ncbi:hypothetical protein HS088_TW12G00394 [Tripterygium wilfordii]|uniref:Uncharacterized protein n=1 Tax=Tripterygium wilfordii TaxID=458696 RepID=A0A7J7CYN7_TRIWF|nr:hypothetical protein HS088_TW12G00394 [Tripterygium wilfordii]